MSNSDIVRGNPANTLLGQLQVPLTDLDADADQIPLTSGIEQKNRYNYQSNPFFR